jgi:hypothetical protein
MADPSINWRGPVHGRLLPPELGVVAPAWRTELLPATCTRFAPWRLDAHGGMQQRKQSDWTVQGAAQNDGNKQRFSRISAQPRASP